MGLVLIFSAFLSLGSAWADWSAIPSTDFEIADFPQNGSAGWRKDFDVLFQEQKSRTKEECAMSAKQPHPTFAAFFGNSELIDSDQFENTKELGNRVAKFADRVATYFKGQYQRPRPYNEVKGLTPCVPMVSGDKAYPSAHATVGVVTACMLADIYPEKKDDLEAYGLEVGNLRYIVGVHHPSDVVAGQKLGQDICERLRKEPDYRAEIKSLKR